MPPVGLHVRSAARAGSAFVRGRVNWTLVLTLAGVALLISALFIYMPPSPPRPAATEVKREAWLGFTDTEASAMVFNTAPALVVHLELSHPWSIDEPEDEEDTLPIDAESDGPWRMQAYEPLRWLDGHAPPLRSLVDPRRIQYKLDPAFGFENRALRIKGMMIRLRIEF